jgi:hypothetical protein
MRIFERWYFGLCSNLRLVIELWYLEGFWSLYRMFLKIIFLHGEIFEFSQFFFFLHILFNVNGNATVWNTLVWKMYLWSSKSTPMLVPGFFFFFFFFSNFVVSKVLWLKKFTSKISQIYTKKRKLPRFSEYFVSCTIPKLSTKKNFLLLQSLKSQILFKLFPNITNITCLD